MPLTTPNSWIVPADSFGDLLDAVYTFAHGEVWLYNNDLKIISDPSQGKELYQRRIFGTYASRISAVKIVLRPELEQQIFAPEISERFQRAFKRIFGEQPRQEDVAKLQFCRRNDFLDRTHKMAGTLGDESWVFYTVDGNIGAGYPGIVLFRPNSRPFNEEPVSKGHAVAWSLRSHPALRTKLATAEIEFAFHESDIFYPLYWTGGANGQYGLGQGMAAPAEFAIARGTRCEQILLAGERLDICIMTAADTETRALRAILSPRTRDNIDPQEPFWQHRVMCLSPPLPPLSVLSAQSKQGSVHSGLLASQLLQRYGCSLLVLTGSCAGRRGRMSIGDVLLAAQILPYEYARLTGSNQRSLRDLMVTIQNPSVDMVAMALSDVSGGTGMPSPSQQGSFSSIKGTIASGFKLVQEQASWWNGWRRRRFWKQLDLYDKSLDVIAADMESEGVFRAVEAVSRDGTDLVVLKGVMDYGDSASRGDERDENQYLATSNALRILLKALEGELGVSLMNRRIGTSIG